MRVALIGAAAAVYYGMALSPELTTTNAILDAARTPAVVAFPAATLRDPITIEPDKSNLDRTAIMRRLFKSIKGSATDDQETVLRVAEWTQSYFVHPMETPLRSNGQGVYDPIQLLKVRRAQCGQVNRVMLDILAAGGYRGRIVQLKAHHGAEVFYGGSWHYIEADALHGGDQIMTPDGRLPSAAEIHANPNLVDGKCLGCEVLLLDTWLSDEHRERFDERIGYSISGQAWREVFSAVPYYYEKSGGTNDPEYGWLTYATTY
ncbi:MAG: hypothetical protein R3D44_05910 [Hyphomicrobiaceae bacterium]